MLNSARSLEYGGVSDLWRSADEGQTWQKIWAANGIKSVAITDDSVAILTADSVFIAVDGGLDFAYRHKTPPLFPIIDIFWLQGDLHLTGEDELHKTSDI